MNIHQNDSILLPCAFCSGIPKLHQSNLNSFVIYCDTCKIQTARSDKLDFICVVWNTRKPSNLKLSDSSYLAGLKFGKEIVRTQLFKLIDDVIYANKEELKNNG